MKRKTLKGLVKFRSAYCLLLTFVLCTLLSAPFAGAADKLLVKDSLGNTKFVVTDAGQVGVGTATPLVMFDSLGPHVSGTGMARFAGSGPYGFMVADTSANSGSDEAGFLLKAAGTLVGQFGIRQSDNSVYIKNRVYGTTEIMTFTSAGRVGIGTASPTHLIQLSGGAYSDGAVWTNASSRELKENIKELSAKEAMEALTNLNPVTFNYKAAPEDGHVGFIAEDVPDIVATKDRKGLSSMDIVAVLTKVIQEQQKKISDLSEQLNTLQREVRYKSDVASIMNRE